MNCSMSFLNEIYSEIEQEYSDGEAQVAHMSAFYALINYFELIDNGSGLLENELINRFYNRNEYKTIIQKLISHNVLVKSNDGVFILNKQAKEIITPIFDNLMSFQKKKDNLKPGTDPSLHLVYNYKSRLFISE